MSEVYWSPKRQALYRWLFDCAPSLAELYEGALRLLYGPEHSCPGRARFIAHAVREIRDNILKYLRGSTFSQFQWKNRLDRLAELWEQEGLPFDGSLPATMEEEQEYDQGGTVPIEVTLFEETANILNDHLEARRKPMDITKELFSELAPENESAIDQLKPSMQQWITTTRWFVQHVHDDGARDDELIDDEFVALFEQFEDMLASLTMDFFFSTEELDDILEDANS